jgi:hypothetical protein
MANREKTKSRLIACATIVLALIAAPFLLVTIAAQTGDRR